MQRLETKDVFKGEPFAPLQYSPLSIIDGFELPSSESDASEAQAELHHILADKPWLLDTDQPIDLPTLSIENETSPLFTLSDFIIQQNAKAERDVTDSAVDSKTGERLKPTPDQMAQLKRDGRLTVPSRNFEDQSHFWEVTGSFYLGGKRKNERFRAGLGGAVDHLVVHELDAIFGVPYRTGTGRCLAELWTFSLFSALRDGFVQAFTHLWKHVRNFMPWTKIEQQPKYQTHHINAAVDEAERLYVNYHMRKTNPEYCHKLENHGFSSTETRKDLREGTDWSSEYFPKSDSKEEELRKDIAVRIETMRSETRASLAGRKEEELEINEKRMRRSPRAALQERRAAEVKWRHSTLNETIRAFQTKQDPALQVEASRLYAEKTRRDMEHKDNEDRSALETEYELNLCKRRPVFSASPIWRRRQLDIYRQKISAKQQTSFQARLLEALRRDESSDGELAKQAVLPIELSDKFHHEEAQGIREAMKAERVPNRPTEVKIYRLRPDASGQMFTTSQVHSDKPLWRAKLYGLKFVSWFSHFSFGALRFLLNGPLSFRALLSPSPFSANVGGGPPTSTPTLISRLKDFFAALRQIRQDFENAPSYSILGKSIQRIFLQVYLGLKSVIGSIAIVSFMVLGTAITTALSLATLITSPVLAVVFVSIRALFDILIFDSSNPHPKWGIFSAFVCSAYFLLVPGLLQATGATIALAVHPLIGVVRLSWSCVRYSWSSLRDAFSWTVIRRNVVLPTTDDFLARRIQGPGLASNHLYRLNLQQALQVVQAVLDGVRLRGYIELRRAEILAPSNKFELLLKKAVSPFGFFAERKMKPSDICWKLVSNYEKYHPRSGVRDHRSLSPQNNQENIWDDFAQQIRQSHPSNTLNSMNAAVEQQTIDFNSHDASVTAWLGRSVAVSNLLKEAKDKGLYCKVAANEGLVLAKLTIMTSVRQIKLFDICRLPPNMQSKFRLPEDEIQLLWDATMSLARRYADEIRTDLYSIAEQSEQSDTILPVAKRIADAFWTNAGSRPGKDIEIVASHLLSIVFGGELMLEPLENVDKQLILIPKISEEDKHLDFFGLRDRSEDEYRIVERKDVILDT